MKRGIYIFLINVIILFCPVCINENAKAQIDSAKISFLEMSLEELLNLEVVSVSRIPEKTSDAPATIHLITENQIKTRGYTNS